MRKETIAKNIERDLNAKNSAEGNADKVEVDVDSVDWLYGTYKIKGDETVYHREEESSIETNENGKESETSQISNSEPEKIDVSEMEVIQPKANAEDEPASIFSAKESTMLKITEFKAEESQNLDDNAEETDDFEIWKVSQMHQSDILEKADKPFGPVIEILDDESDGENSETRNTSSLLSSSEPQSSKILIKDITLSVSDNKEDEYRITDLSDKATESHSQPLIQEINSTALENQNEEQIERPTDKTSEELLSSLGAIANSKVAKEGVIDFTPNVLSGETEEENEKRIMDEELEGLD